MTNADEVDVSPSGPSHRTHRIKSDYLPADDGSEGVLAAEPEPEDAASRSASSSSRAAGSAFRVKPGGSQSKTSVASSHKDKISSAAVGATPFSNATPASPPELMATSSFFDNLKLELDAASMILFLIALSTRFYKLDEPRAVVFDELNFGRFASHYFKRVFYFDVHPPLGKMLIAAAASYGVIPHRPSMDDDDETSSKNAEGFDFVFDSIGTEIPASIPLWHLRFVPAFCGSLLAPLTYHLLLEVGCSSWTASLGALLIILDNALLVQSHFILLEPILLCAIAFCFISLLKFIKCPKSISSPLSFFWLISLGVFLGAAISIKYSAVYCWIMCCVAVSVDFWYRQLPDISISWRVLVFRGSLCFGAVLALPIAIYSGIFSAHLMWLHKAGPHDHVMTSAFQASLEGGLSSIIKGQPPFVKIGSQITLRHTFGQPPCWLHSHQHVYPLKYPDERGSSHQQQVTCYAFKDVNNWWIVKDPDSDAIPKDLEDARTVQHGDVIQLLHGTTGRALNSHDVAAPLSPENQEVSCYIDYNVSMPAQNLWRVEIVGFGKDGVGNGGGGGASSSDQRWRTILSQVRLIHVETKQALKSTQKDLPEWGFHQTEVATERVTGIEQKATLWNVEEHRAPKRAAEGEQEESADKVDQMDESDLLPIEDVMTLREKMYELQMKMITTIHDIPQEHRYGSTPNEWPLMDTTVGYWVSGETHAQIHLLGNPVIWKTGAAATLLYLLLLGIYLLFFHRGWMRPPGQPQPQQLHHRRQGVEDSDGEEEEESDGESSDIAQDQTHSPNDSSSSSASASTSVDWWNTFQRGGWLLIGGYFLHYIPYFVYDHTLFLHHYIPALYFKIMSLAFVLDHLGGSFWCGRARILQHLLSIAVVVWLAYVAVIFKMLAPLSYGDAGLTADQLKELQLNDNWDFVFH